MKRPNFFKRYFLHSFNYFFEFSYVVLVTCVSIFISLFFSFLTYLNYNNNLIKTLDIKSIIFIFLIFIFIFFNTFIFCFIFRFFTNLVFFNSKKNVQRYVSVIFCSVYVFSCYNIAYNLNFNVIQNDKLVNFIFIIFAIFSMSFFIIKNKFFFTTYFSKLISIFFILSLIFFFDFFTNKFIHNKFIENYKYSEVYVFFYNPVNFNILSQTIHENNLLVNKLKNPIQTMSGLEVINLLNSAKSSGKQLSINNLSSSFINDEFTSLSNNKGIICKKDVESNKNYKIYLSFFPILNIVPEKILFQITPQLFCLKFGNRTVEKALNGVYTAVVNSDEKLNANFNFVGISQEEVDTFIKKYQERFASYTDLFNKTKFYLIEN
jgi:hypothetical protein